MFVSDNNFGDIGRFPSQHYSEKKITPRPVTPRPAMIPGVLVNWHVAKPAVKPSTAKPFMRKFAKAPASFGDIGSLGSLKNKLKKAVTAPLAPMKKLNTTLVNKTIKPVLSTTKKFNTTLLNKTVKPVARPLMKIAKAPAAMLAKKSPMAASILMPIETMMLQKDEAKKAVAVSNGVEIAVADRPLVDIRSIADGPLVKIYLKDGSEGEIPSNYVSKSGTYMEAGVTWTTTPPKIVTVYSVNGDIADIPEGMLTFGKYTDEGGNVWSTIPPTPPSPEGQTVAQKIADALAPTVASVTAPVGTPVPLSMTSGSYPEPTYGPAYYSEPSVPMNETERTESIDSGSGYEEEKVTTGVVPSKGFSIRLFLKRIIEALQLNSSSMNGLGEANFLDTLNENMSKISQLQQTAKSYGQAYRGLKRDVLGDKGASAPIVLPPQESDGKLLGLPAPVVYGGAAVSVAGLVLLLVKLRRGRGKG